jgi:peptidoglycan/LPS O-acetylase OafA/YrhL
MLGLITYPLYLLHQDIGFILLRSAPSGLNRLLLLCTVMAAMIVLSWVVHIGPEKWLLSRLKSLLVRPQNAAVRIKSVISDRFAGSALQSAISDQVIPAVIPAPVSSPQTLQTQVANSQVAREADNL